MGVLQTPRTRYSLDDVKVWAMDNGCFTGAYPGDDEFMAFLAKHEPHRARCLFVCAPDVVGDAERTLALFPPMAARIRAAGWPVALVGQDGMTEDTVPWGQFDWLFIGGSTGWKLGAARELAAAAIDKGVRVHVGRVNSARRFRMFAGLGCHSADGTVLAFGADANIGRVLSWIDPNVQLALI